MNHPVFSDFGQVGLIVKDIEKAEKGFAKLGIGPFDPLLKIEPTVRWEEQGRPIQLDLKVRLAHLGSLEIELIEPISDSMQKHALETKGEGIHHVGLFVDDLDAAVEWMAAKGYKVVQRGWRPNGGGFAYFDTEEDCGCPLEFLQR